ncbi:MAG: PaaI family thioesterase [Candidatus Nanopelagicales bacterium]
MAAGANARRGAAEGVTHPPEDAARPQPMAGAPLPGDRVPSHYRWCMGCGSDHPGGLHMKVIAGDDLTMHCQLVVSDFHQGAPGLAHGGIMTTAMDEAMGVLNRFFGKPAVTVHLAVDFRRPVPVGTTLFIRTRVAGVRGRKVFTEGTAHIGDPDGPIAIGATALFLQVPLEHFLEHGSPDHIAQAVADRAAGGPSWIAEVNP